MTTETSERHGADAVAMIPRRYGRKLLGTFSDPLAKGEQPHCSDIVYYVKVGEEAMGAQGISYVGMRSGVSRGEAKSEPFVTVMVTTATGAGFPAELAPVQALAMAEQLKLAARDAVRAATTYDSHMRNSRSKGGTA